MKRLLLLLLMLTLTTSVSFAAKKQTVVASTIQLSEQELTYNDGIEKLKEGKYDDAIEKFSRAISIDSLFDKAYFNRAIAYTNMGVYARALGDINTVIRHSGENTNSDNHILKAKIYNGIGDIKSATEEIDKALEIDPSNTNALLDKAALFQSTKQNELAIAAYISYNYKTGGSAASFNELGNCYYNVGDKRVATECFQTAYHADSTNTSVCFNLAKCTWEFYQDTVKALKLVDALISKEITNAEYYNLKGYICYQAGDSATADTNFDLAIKNGNLAQAHNGKGLIQMKAGNYPEAIKHFNDAITANLNYGDAYLNRGIAKETFEDYTGACEDFLKATELGAANANEYYTKQCK